MGTVGGLLNDPEVYLGLKEGYADKLSPDGRFALAETSSRKELMILPTGAGDPRALPAGNIAAYVSALWFPDARRIIVNGREPGRSPRAYVQEVPDGLPRAFTPENTWISPRGHRGCRACNREHQRRRNALRAVA